MGGRREFQELFWPELPLPDLDFFTGTFLKTEVQGSKKVVRKANEVAAELRLRLVERGYLTPSRLKELDESVKVCERLKRRLRPILRRLGMSLVTVDASMLADDDYVASDSHWVGRVEAGRIWLRVHRGAAPEEIGPVAVPDYLSPAARLHAPLRSRAAPGALAVGRVFGGPPSRIDTVPRQGETEESCVASIAELSFLSSFQNVNCGRGPIS